MDRPRKPGSKAHTSPFMMSGLIALGKTKATAGAVPNVTTPEPETISKPKTTTSSSSLSSSSKISTKVSSSSSSGSTTATSGLPKSGSAERKREGDNIPGSTQPLKKTKLHGHSSSVPGAGSSSSLPSTASIFGSYPAGGTEKKSQKKDSEYFIKQFETMDLNEAKFLKFIQKLEEMDDAPTTEAFFLTCLRRLRQLKEKPDLRFCELLLLAAQEKAVNLRSQAAIEAMCSLAKTKRSGIDFKIKPGQYVPIMGAALGVNMIVSTHADVATWPVNFVQIWLEDACHERYWVDRPECEDFVNTLLASFETLTPDKDLLPPAEHAAGAPGSSSPAVFNELESEYQDELAEILGYHKTELEAIQRFAGSIKSVELMIVEYAKEIIQKRSPELPKNLFRMLGSTCGLQEVRSFIISRIEQWLHNPKCSKQAQELLMYLCVNAKSYRSPGADGGQYIVQICKLRMKTKQLTQLFSVAMREMVRDDSLNLKNVLVQIVYNELSLQRNPTNYPVLGSVLSAFPEARSELAIIFMDLLQKKEEFIVALRQILRDSMRACRHDCNLSDFVFGLLNVRELAWPEGTEMRNRVFRNVVDLVVFSLFLSFTPNVKEASVSRSEKNVGVLTNFYNQIAKVQEEALSWLYSVAMKLYRPLKVDYVAALYKFILKDPVNDLNYKENWPTESDRNMFARHCLEVPLLEPAFMWVLFQGFSKEHNFFTAAEILDATEMLVMKAAMHGGRIEISKPDLVDSLFRLAEYKHPENIALPIGYTPPKLGITKSCWRVWTMLLILASYNPTVIGKKGWEMLPTLKVLMEMCMTNHFIYPTLASTETVEEITSRELQLSAIEKEQILEFETHLAAASTKCTITEKSSILLAQLITLDPYGKPRTPQPWVTPHLKSLNEQLRLGYRFCRSRNPDFLVDLMQGKTESMPWLSELVTEGSFEILPVRSLCEFMLGQTDRLVRIHNSENDGIESSGSGGGDKSPKKGHRSQATELVKEDTKSLQLLQYLQNTVQKTSEDTAAEILEFFFRRLSFPKAQSRLQGIQALQLLFSTPKKPLDDNWLLETIPALPLFSDVRETLTKCLREAIQVENEPAWIARYLEFLSVWGVVESDTILDNLALDVTQLVVERCIVIQALLTHNPEVYDSLFDIYLNYMKKIREPGKDCQQWTGSIEQVLVRWDKAGLEANMNILIVHAIVILLSSYAEISAGHDESKKASVLSSSRDKGPSAVTELRYNELLEMWFPKQIEFAPKGLLLNTVEEAVLFPDWIKLRMIRSNNTRLLAAASEDLDIDQLVLFVQSFGIPIQSMTGLLYCLDKAVEESPQKMTESILDPRYMKTIVEVQWKRGAKGGEKFFRLLNQLAVPEEEAIEKFQVQNSYNPRPVLVLPPAQVRDPSKKPFLRSLNVKPTIPVQTKQEAPMDTSAPEDLNIRSLAKQLLDLSSPLRRRRSSIPALEEPGTSASSTPTRRYSMTQDQRSDDSPASEIGKATTVGQLVDIIREVEPCIVKNALDVQLALLFGRSEITPQCRAFLLTVLTHESGWQTVEECLTLFLTEFVSSYDPTAVLDLINSTISNPKLWQGVDKYVPKHQKQLSIFNLTNNQLLVMAEYIVEEISQLEMKSTIFSISNLLGKTEPVVPKNGKKMKICLQERVSLWLRCCHQDKEIVDTVMNTLAEKKSRNPCTKKFLAQIYVEFPQVILTENWKEKPEDLLTNSDETGSCVLDTVSHILINAVANVQPGKEWAKKVTHEYELCLRKIASVHPILLLRQLPLMGVLLEGRVHLEFQVFHTQNHHVPFRVFLGLFDLMQPHVLKQFKILKPMLGLYMQLFENFGHMKDYGMTVSRCSVLLHNLLQTNPTEMKEFLGKHYSILKELTTQSYYLTVGPLQNLITSVVPPSTNSEISILTQNRKEMDPISMSAKQSNEIHDKLEHAMNNDEVMTALSELETLSTQNPAVLHEFSDYLNSYLVSDLEGCRQISFNLILKHMTYSPGASNLYLKSILQALQAQGGSRTIESFMDRIPEFVVLAQDNADVILTQMFELGLSSSMSMLPTIIKSLGLLRSQIGT